MEMQQIVWYQAVPKYLSSQYRNLVVVLYTVDAAQQVYYTL